MIYFLKVSRKCFLNGSNIAPKEANIGSLRGKTKLDIYKVVALQYTHTSIYIFSISNVLKFHGAVETWKKYLKMKEKKKIEKHCCSLE